MKASILRAFGIAFRRNLKKVITKPRLPTKAKPRSGLSKIELFGKNPGALSMTLYVPANLPRERPLVVVLHGCGQSAAGFAMDAGWIALADDFKLALVLPGQSISNNRGRCFNWFRYQDVHRTGGEAASIRQMVSTAMGLLKSDRKQIFVAGFSAGGGMAAALLGAYPALFSAGAVVAGMPVGSATTPIGALIQMRSGDSFRQPAELVKDVLQATGTTVRKHWPRMSIWQGEQDHTVNPKNADLLTAQWRELHNLTVLPEKDIVMPGARLRTWSHTKKKPSIELWTLPELGHGFPIDRNGGTGGNVARWVTDVGIAAAYHIAEFWGLKR